MIHYRLTGYARWTGESLYEEVRQINEELHGEFHADVRIEAERLLMELFPHEMRHVADFEMYAILERVIQHGVYRYRGPFSESTTLKGHLVFIPPKK